VNIKKIIQFILKLHMNGSAVVFVS